MRRSLVIIGQIAISLAFCVFVFLAGFTINDPLLRRDFAQAPAKAVDWVHRTARNMARSAELAVRPDIIEPERFHFDIGPDEHEFVLYRFVQTYPWITDGASLTFQFPRRYVLRNIASGSGVVPEVPIQCDFDTRRPLTCMPNCQRTVGAMVSLPQTYIPSPPRPEEFLTAPPLPEGKLQRGLLRNKIYAVVHTLCDFELYEADGQRLDNVLLDYPFDRASIFRREAASGRAARTVVCDVRHANSNCRTIDPCELGMKIEVTFPRAMLCEADEVMQRARKIFDDHLVKRTDPVPGWGRRAEIARAVRLGAARASWS